VERDAAVRLLAGADGEAGGGRGARDAEVVGVGAVLSGAARVVRAEQRPQRPAGVDAAAVFQARVGVAGDADARHPEGVGDRLALRGSVLRREPRGVADGEGQPEFGAHGGAALAAGRDAVTPADAAHHAAVRRGAGTAGARRAARARGAAPAAVAGAGVGVHLAAVGLHAVAVGEARVARGDAAGPRDAGGDAVADRAGGPAGAAVRRVAGDVELAAVGGVAVAVGEARVAGEAAGARGAGRRGVGARRTHGAARAAVVRVGAAVGAAP